MRRVTHMPPPALVVDEDGIVGSDAEMLLG